MACGEVSVIGRMQGEIVTGPKLERRLNREERLSAVRIVRSNGHVSHLIAQCFRPLATTRSLALRASAVSSNSRPGRTTESQHLARKRFASDT